MFNHSASSRRKRLKNRSMLTCTSSEQTAAEKKPIEKIYFNHVTRNTKNRRRRTIESSGVRYVVQLVFFVLIAIPIHFVCSFIFAEQRNLFLYTHTHNIHKKCTFSLLLDRCRRSRDRESFCHSQCQCHENFLMHVRNIYVFCFYLVLLLCHSALDVAAHHSSTRITTNAQVHTRRCRRTRELKLQRRTTITCQCTLSWCIHTLFAKFSSSRSTVHATHIIQVTNWKWLKVTWFYVTSKEHLVVIRCSCRSATVFFRARKPPSHGKNTEILLFYSSYTLSTLHK